MDGEGIGSAEGKICIPHRLGNEGVDGGEGGAVGERVAADGRDTIWDRDAGERGAVGERGAADARYAVADGDGGEAGAVTERAVADARD